ncbi:MAG TPA: GNAT family N-acetyltransferase [Gaiellaceae bacterium]|jgi:predicted GNAT family acetyltransferase
MAPTLLELADDGWVHLPPRPGDDRVDADRYVFFGGRHESSVQRIRLADTADLEEAVDATRALARERGSALVRWWVGDLATPAGARDELLRLGLAPDVDEAVLTSMALVGPPESRARDEIDVRRVESVDDYVRAIEIDARSWDTTEEAVAHRLARAREQWPAMHAEGRTYVYLAHVDGEPVGFARAVVVGDAALMNGGTVVRHARGRGVYRALVDARRRDLAEHGVASLVTQAGSMSRPILERLGFEPLGEIRLLVDRL